MTDIFYKSNPRDCLPVWMCLQAKSITLVCDNLITPAKEVLYGTFPAGEAGRLTHKIEIKHMPQEGSKSPNPKIDQESSCLFTSAIFLNIRIAPSRIRQPSGV